MGWFRWKLDTLGGVGTCLGWVFIEACLKMSKNDLLSMFMHMRTRACIWGLHSCVHGWDLCVCGPIHAYAYLFLSSCVCGFQPAYACLVSMYADTSLRAYVTSQEPVLTPVSSVSYPNEGVFVILVHCWIFFFHFLPSGNPLGIFEIFFFFLLNYT